MGRVGSALMERWLQQLQRPVHRVAICSRWSRTRARKFFEKSGFGNHGNPTLVGGMRGKRGERLHQQIMVWNP